MLDCFPGDAASAQISCPGCPGGGRGRFAEARRPTKKKLFIYLQCYYAEHASGLFTDDEFWSFAGEIKRQKARGDNGFSDTLRKAYGESLDDFIAASQGHPLLEAGRQPLLHLQGRGLSHPDPVQRHPGRLGATAQLSGSSTDIDHTTTRHFTTGLGQRLLGTERQALLSGSSTDDTVITTVHLQQGQGHRRTPKTGLTALKQPDSIAIVYDAEIEDVGCLTQCIACLNCYCFVEFDKERSCEDLASDLDAPFAQNSHVQLTRVGPGATFLILLIRTCSAPRYPCARLGRSLVLPCGSPDRPLRAREQHRNERGKCKSEPHLHHCRRINYPSPS